MRKMIWIRTARIETWGCSQCVWTFNPSDPLRGSSLEEMKENYLSQRQREFASHICAEHPKAKSARLETTPDFPSDLTIERSARAPDAGADTMT
jgi:hypothetical protein